jgi:hypothetical protein
MFKENEFSDIEEQLNVPYGGKMIEIIAIPL